MRHMPAQNMRCLPRAQAAAREGGGEGEGQDRGQRAAPVPGATGSGGVKAKAAQVGGGPCLPACLLYLIPSASPLLHG